jgi:hypothetical protein
LLLQGLFGKGFDGGFVDTAPVAAATDVSEVDAELSGQAPCRRARGQALAILVVWRCRWVL